MFFCQLYIYLYIYVYIYIYIYIYYWFYIPLSHANTSERSAGQRVWCLGPFAGFYLHLRQSACYRTSSLQPKYQTRGVNYTALYDHSLSQPYSAQPTLLACQCRGPRIKFQIGSCDRKLNPGPFAPAAECTTIRPARPRLWLMFDEISMWCNEDD